MLRETLFHTLRVIKIDHGVETPDLIDRQLFTCRAAYPGTPGAHRQAVANAITERFLRRDDDGFRPGKPRAHPNRTHLRSPRTVSETGFQLHRSGCDRGGIERAVECQAN